MTVLMILWALGFTIGLDKSVFCPVRRPTWLEMIKDIPNLTFAIPEYKLQDFINMVSLITELPRVYFRALASAAGKLLPFMPAVRLAKLYARSLYLCMRGAKSSWDEVAATPHELLDSMNWLVLRLRL